MASRRRFGVSRSVALSLAALLVLTGAMFMVTTFQQDSEEWVLVEDQVLDDGGVIAATNSVGSAEYVFTFDEDTSVYTFNITGGDKSVSNVYNLYTLSALENFDYSKNYKIVLTSSDVSFYQFFLLDSLNVVTNTIDLRSVQSSDDGSYSAEVVLLDQYVTDFHYKERMVLNCSSGTASSTFADNTVTFSVYELQTDNTGSIAAGITGLVLIVMGVFAMPMHNIFRRR